MATCEKCGQAGLTWIKLKTRKGSRLYLIRPDGTRKIHVCRWWDRKDELRGMTREERGKYGGLLMPFDQFTAGLAKGRALLDSLGLPIHGEYPGLGNPSFCQRCGKQLPVIAERHHDLFCSRKCAEESRTRPLTSPTQPAILQKEANS